MLAAFDHDVVRMYTLAWSIKEAMFKWYGLGGVDFRQHLHIHEIHPGAGWWKASCSFNKDSVIELTAYIRSIEGIYLSWVRKV
jgi:phosphopantetheinyl transferase